jgi:hypothetical protein
LGEVCEDGKVKVDWVWDGVGDEIEEGDSGEEESEDTEMKDEVMMMMMMNKGSCRVC